MKKKEYSNWSKEDLIKEVEVLKKQKTYGLVWEKDKTKESFDHYINWDGIKNEEKFPEAEHKFPVLKEVRDKEIVTEKDKDFNLLIEGDNYHSLATLNFTHTKSIDVIYIDPPYNTGSKDWKYNNDYVDKEDSYRHSKWLSFMEKRLKLAKNLLANNGFLICAIDANELFSVGLLLDELFGEENRVGLVTVIHNPKGRNLSKFFSENSEFMLVYAKNISSTKFNNVVIDEDKQATFNMSDEEGKYRLEPFMRVRTSWSRKNKPNNYYPIYVSRNLKELTLKKKDGYYEIFPKTKDGREWAWKNIPESFEVLNNNSYFTVVKNGEEIEISHKYREKQVFKNVWTNKKYHSEFNGTNMLKNLLGDNLFEYPKSLYLLEDILKITSRKDSVVLDFFAGSGTTGHAVLELNKEDNGNRRFILCTNNENNICTQVTHPRIKKVIQGYKGLRDNKDYQGLGGNLKYFKTDFVDSAPTDKNKKKIVDKSTEMICIKENAFASVKEKKEWKIFKNKDHHLGIIFDEDSIEDFVKEAKKIDGKIHVYVFSLDESVPTKEFKDLKNKVKLCPIPEVILHVYRRIFK